MPDLSISDDQRERLKRVQDHLSDDLAYGHVRPRDALEYLLDEFEAEHAVDSSAVGSDATTAEDEDDTDFEVRNGGSAASSAQGSVVTESDDSEDDPAADEGAETDSSETTDETRLNSVMSLLDDHGDVWREAGGGEEKYEVDLPDGGTERARTKDDVRAVLFKHYR